MLLVLDSLLVSPVISQLEESYLLVGCQEGTISAVLSEFLQIKTVFLYHWRLKESLHRYKIMPLEFSHLEFSKTLLQCCLTYTCCQEF